MMNVEEEYVKYRGKCKELSEDLVASDPTLVLVRGYYYCPIWGEQPHWWCKTSSGTIIDPTKDQFPSRGLGEYVEFDGKVPCAECGKEMDEGDAYIHGNYAFCSSRCLCRFVGL